MRHWGGGGGRGGICAVDGHPSHPPLALKAHWGLQRLGLLGEGLPECLQPTRGPITEDFLSSSMAARRPGDGLGPPGICLLHDAPPPPTPGRALSFRCPLCQVLLLHRAQEKWTGEKQGVRFGVAGD